MSYYYPTGSVMPPTQTDKAGIYSAYPQPGGLPGMGVGAGPPGGMAMGYPSSNGLGSSGLGGMPPSSSLGGIPPRPASLGGIPPSARSPGAAMPGTGLPMGMTRMQPGVPNGMPQPVNGLPPSVSPQAGLGPSGSAIPTAQLQAYPHLAGAAGFSTSQASIYGASSLGPSPYSTQPMTSSYPVSTFAPSMQLSGGPLQSPYSSLGGPASTLPGGGMGSYPGSLTSYPSAMPSMVAPSAVAPNPSPYGFSGIRGPTTATPGAYPGMSPLGGSTQGGYPGQPPSNPGILRASPIVPTPAYPSSNPYGRPL